MTIYAIHTLDPNGNGNILDTDRQCCYWCHTEALSRCEEPHTAVAWPGGSETDYDVFCSECGDQLWQGLETIANPKKGST